MSFGSRVSGVSLGLSVSCASESASGAGQHERLGDRHWHPRESVESLRGLLVEQGKSPRQKAYLRPSESARRRSTELSEEFLGLLKKEGAFGEGRESRNKEADP